MFARRHMDSFHRDLSFTMASMKKHRNKMSGVLLRVVHILLLAGVVSACASSAALPISGEQLTAVSDASTLSEAQITYQSPLLNPLDTPRTYIQDACQYLRNKWNPWNSEPGTVVMILMFNGVYRGEVQSADGVEINDLQKIMKQLKLQGFEAITTKKFLGFMERNVKIPLRSVLIIRDGRYGMENFDRDFGEYWEQWQWPIVNGWVSQADTPEDLWQENIFFENEGFIDHQAQGVKAGTYLTDDSSKVIINRELSGSLTAFAERFGKTPLAFIWPGGGFGQRPVEAARMLGYQLGFTLNSRGPVMYNWVPLADEYDKDRPTYIPEGAIKDPLMTLPRYWPYQALGAMDTVRIIGNEAKAYAEANKAAEFEYYDIVCKPIYGPMPSPSK